MFDVVEGEAIICLVGPAALHQLVHLVVAMLRLCTDVALSYVVDHFGCTHANIRGGAKGANLPEHYSKRPYVALAAEQTHRQCLRTHPPNGHLAGMLHLVHVVLLVSNTSRQAKVCHFAVFILIYQYITSCQVAVNDLAKEESHYLIEGSS